MILELDSGNTLLKWRLLSGVGCLQSEGFLDCQGEEFKFFTQNSLFSKVKTLLVSNVSKRKGVSLLCDWYKSVLGPKNVFIAKSKKKLGKVRFAYAQVERLGIDRCLAMVAGYQLFPDGLLVVDCGSAITADIVTGEGVHVGGYIVPGLRLVRSSLMKGAAKIKVEGDVDQSCTPGVTTEECISNGINTMIISAIRAFKDLSKEYGIKHFVLTGGDADYIRLLGLHEFLSCKDLVFQGLEIVSPYLFCKFSSIERGDG